MGRINGKIKVKGLEKGPLSMKTILNNPGLLFRFARYHFIPHGCVVFEADYNGGIVFEVGYDQKIGIVPGLMVPVSMVGAGINKAESNRTPLYD